MAQRIYAQYRRNSTGLKIIKQNQNKKKGFYSVSPHSLGSMEGGLLFLRSTDASCTDLSHKLQS